VNVIIQQTTELPETHSFVIPYTEFVEISKSVAVPKIKKIKLSSNFLLK
jgi:hypothetical protein